MDILYQLSLLSSVAIFDGISCIYTIPILSTIVYLNFFKGNKKAQSYIIKFKLFYKNKTQ